jgi:cytochrome oxidase assembly protein ShyY1
VYRFLLSRQWVILTLVVLLLIPAMVELGFWQLHRHERRVARNEQIARNLGAPAVPVGQLTRPGRTVPRADTWRPVSATGTYDARHEVVARQRIAADERSVGYYVLTPLLLQDGRAVLVNRGWVPAGTDLTAFPEVPPPPAGAVTVTGRLMPDETTATTGIRDKQGLPPRQVMLIDGRQQAGALSRPVLGGYIELTGASPKPGDQPEPVPEPDHSSIGAHLAYAIQWWLFTAGVPVGWVILVRRERRELLAAGRQQEGARTATVPAA